MIRVEYSKEGIRVEVGEVSKYNSNLPFKMNIKKHISGEHQWGVDLNNFWSYLRNREYKLKYEGGICEAVR